MITRERVESVLARVRPFLQADGGDIELLDVDGNSRRRAAHRHVRRLSERAHDAARRRRGGAARGDPGVRNAAARLRCVHDVHSRSPWTRSSSASSARMRAVFEFLRVIGNSDSTVLITGESGTGKEVTATLHPPEQPPQAPSVRRRQLRAVLRNADRVGAVRPRARRLHRRDQGPAGPVRAGRGRHDLPRRHRRRAAVDAGEAAARAAEPDDRAAGRHADRSRQRARHRRQQARSEAAGRRGEVPRGPVLPAERAAADAAAAARAARRHPGADGRTSSSATSAAAARTCRPSPTPSSRPSCATRWPGNVRELENACERIAQTCSCGTVRVGCMSASILFRAGAQPAGASRRRCRAAADAAPISLDDRLREVEANLIRWALKVSGGNKSRAAELLQIKRSTLGDRINHCGLDDRAAASGEPAPAGRPLALAEAG